MLRVQNPAPLPHEFRGGAQVRPPIPGRLDNIPRAMPPIVEHLTRERRESGRIGHFSSRRPLLGVTAEQEGSIPMPMPSTQAMFPAPMPPHLFNHPRDSIERADWTIIEQPLITGTADYPEFHRRLHQDRGNYRRPVNADEIGEQEVTPRPPHTDFPYRPVPTDRTQIENKIGFYESVSQGNIARGDREAITRTRKGGEFVNNRGSVALKTLVEHGLGIQIDHRNSLIVETDVSGGPTNLHQANTLIDPRTFRNRDTTRIFRTEVSGNPESLNPAPLRLDEGFFADRRPVNSTIDTDVSFGPDLYLDFAADRFQKQRTHMFEHRAEVRSDPASREVWEGHVPPRTLFDRPPMRGRENRVTQKDELQNTGRADVGKIADALRPNPFYHDAHHFYARLQAGVNSK